MADMISILVFMIFAYFAGKKLIIPRIVAARAAKKGTPAAAEAPRMEGIPAVQAAVQAAVQTGTRPVTCFDMRIVCTIVGDNEDVDDVLTQRITYAASEMLLNASVRGSDVRLHVVNAFCNAVMLYVTYTVR